MRFDANETLNIFIETAFFGGDFVLKINLDTRVSVLY